MKKNHGRYKTIKFNSHKNGGMIIVHSEAALRYARKLENEPEVVSYETSVPLPNWQSHILLTSIRASYRAEQWDTDFMLVRRDGSVAIREVVFEHELFMLAKAEQLEISRRYWGAANIPDWGIVLVKDV